MKRIVLLILLNLPLLLQAQFRNWWIYPSIGVDMGGTIPFPLSDIPGGVKGTPKLNPNLGLGFGHSISDKWNLGFEVNYHVLAFSAVVDVRSQPFNAYNDTLYFSGHTSTDVELRFVEFPLTAVYTVNPKWSLILGAYYSRILEGKFNTNGSNGIASPNKAITDTASLPGPANVTYNFNDKIDKWDAGLLIGYQYSLNPRLYFWGRLQVGFKSIFVKEFMNIDYDMYQVRLNAGVSVTLFSNKKNSSDE